MLRIPFILTLIYRTLIFLPLLFSGITAWANSPADETLEENPMISAQFINVLNGNTIIVRINGVNDRLHLAGVTMLNPQLSTVPGGPSGTKASSSIWDLLKGEHVLLAFPYPHRDQYGRMPAYIYRQSDLLFLNHEIILQGYGQTNRDNTFKYQDVFLQAEHDARQAGDGLWKSRLLAEEQLAQKPQLPLPQDIFACDINPDN